MLYDPFRRMVLEELRCRCVRCGKYSETVHEIVPKSRRPKTWMQPENRVVLCIECHVWAHSKGAKSSAEELTRLRKQRLEEYARSC